MNLLPTPSSQDSAGRATFQDYTQSPTLTLKKSMAILDPPLEVEEIFTTPDATMKLTSSSQKDTEDDEEVFDDSKASVELGAEVLLTLRKLQELEESNISQESLLELKSMILRLNLKNTILKNEFEREKLIFKHEKEMLLNQLENCQQTMISQGIQNEAITARNIKLSKYIRLLKEERIKRYVNENRQLRARIDHLSQGQGHVDEAPENILSSPTTPLRSKLNTLGRIASVYLEENRDPQ